jgi:FixJ family two-component response regulator
MSRRSSGPSNQSRARDVRLTRPVMVAGADGVSRVRADLDLAAGPIRSEVTGVKRFSVRRQAGTLTLLDRVEDRDRAVLAMLLERVHPDDIAAALGISAAAVRLRRTHIAARLRRAAKPSAPLARPEARLVARSA